MITCSSKTAKIGGEFPIQSPAMIVEYKGGRKAVGVIALPLALELKA